MAVARPSIATNHASEIRTANHTPQEDISRVQMLNKSSEAYRALSSKPFRGVNVTARLAHETLFVLSLVADAGIVQRELR